MEIIERQRKYCYVYIEIVCGLNTKSKAKLYSKGVMDNDWETMYFSPKKVLPKNILIQDKGPSPFFDVTKSKREVLCTVREVCVFAF